MMAPRLDDLPAAGRRIVAALIEADRAAKAAQTKKTPQSEAARA